MYNYFNKTKFKRWHAYTWIEKQNKIHKKIIFNKKLYFSSFKRRKATSIRYRTYSYIYSNYVFLPTTSLVDRLLPFRKLKKKKFKFRVLWKKKKIKRKYLKLYKITARKYHYSFRRIRFLRKLRFEPKPTLNKAQIKQGFAYKINSILDKRRKLRKKKQVFELN